MFRRNKVTLARSVLQEAGSYSLSDYPCVISHLPFRETSGNILTDEKTGQIYNPSLSAAGNSLLFAGPDYSVAITALGVDNAANSYPLSGGSYPTIPAGKFAISIMSYYSDGDKGSNTVGTFNSITPAGPVFWTSNNNGLHSRWIDDAGHSLLLDAGPELPSAGNYAACCIIRPIGQNLEGVIYTEAGDIAVNVNPLQQTSVNVDIGDLTPANYSGALGQTYNFQRIIYQFDTEPSDLVQIIRWHALMAPRGVKSPYPMLKGRT